MDCTCDVMQRQARNPSYSLELRLHAVNLVARHCYGKLICLEDNCACVWRARVWCVCVCVCVHVVVVALEIMQCAPAAVSNRRIDRPEANHNNSKSNKHSSNLKSVLFTRRTASEPLLLAASADCTFSSRL
jgi:hypothetical protein